MDAVLYFMFSFFERNMANTDAASVELITDPIRKLSTGSVLSTKRQNKPTSADVMITPADDSNEAFNATGRATLHFVPKPP